MTMSPRLSELLKEAETFFPPGTSEDQPTSDMNGHSWYKTYGFDKYAFVDAATAQAGMPPGGGMDPAAMAAGGGMPPGGDPAAMGGAPPMDPAAMADPAAAGAMDPAAAGLPPMDPAAAAQAGLPTGTGAPAVDPTTGQPVPPKIKVDTNAVLLQVLRLMALMADYLKIPVPASLLTVMPNELMSLPQQPTAAPSGGGGGGGGGEAAAAAGPESSIPPIEPIEPISPAMPKQSGFDVLIGQAEATQLKQGW